MPIFKTGKHIIVYLANDLPIGIVRVLHEAMDHPINSKSMISNAWFLPSPLFLSGACAYRSPCNAFPKPTSLWFLLAAAVPIAIHLLNRRRHKTIQWAAMQFLLKATRESRGKKKLRHILILTCRALGIAALAFAAARPIISGLSAGAAGRSIPSCFCSTAPPRWKRSPAMASSRGARSSSKKSATP